MPKEISQSQSVPRIEFGDVSGWEQLKGTPWERFLQFHPEDCIPKDRFGRMAADHQSGKPIGFADLNFLPGELFDFATTVPLGVGDEEWFTMIGRWMISGKEMLPKSREFLADTFEEYSKNSGRRLSQAA